MTEQFPPAQHLTVFLTGRDKKNYARLDQALANYHLPCSLKLPMNNDRELVHKHIFRNVHFE